LCDRPSFPTRRSSDLSRSSSSISSALIDYVSPVPAYVQSCSATGVVFEDSNGNGTQDSGETGLAGLTFYVDLNGNGSKDAGEPSDRKSTRLNSSHQII